MPENPENTNVVTDVSMVTINIGYDICVFGVFGHLVRSKKILDTSMRKLSGRGL